MVIYKQQPSQLEWDRHGNRIRFPPEAVACKIRRLSHKPGRPSIVAGEHGPVHIDINSNMQALRMALRGETGMFSLHPVDVDGNELEPVAEVEVIAVEEDSPARALVAGAASAAVPVDVETTRAYAQVPLRLFDLFGQMLASRDAHDEMMSSVLKTLVTSTANIQQSTAGLLNTANTTVKVANGVEALERPQASPLDIQGLAESVSAIEKINDLVGSLGKNSKSQTPWVVQLINGPIGMGLMGLLNNLAQAAAAHAQDDDGTDNETDDESKEA